MKKILLLILLTVFMFGCTSEVANQAGEEIDNEKVSSISGGVMGKEVSYEEIEDLFKQSENGNYMVEYDMESEGQMASVKLYRKGSKFRMDTLAQGYDMRVYSVDTKSHMCTLSEETWSCLKIESDETDLANPSDKISTNFDWKDTVDEYKIVKEGSVTISGTKAPCYNFIAPDGEQKMCISEEGVLLYSEMIVDGNLEKFEAKSYSTKVYDSDFEIPKGAVIQDFSNMGN